MGTVHVCIFAPLPFRVGTTKCTFQTRKLTSAMKTYVYSVMINQQLPVMVCECVCVLHVHFAMSFMLILLCHSRCVTKATAGPSMECSGVMAEQPLQAKSESETKTGTI